MVHLGLSSRQSKVQEVLKGKKSSICLYGISRASVKQSVAYRKQKQVTADYTRGQRPQKDCRQSPGRVSTQLIHRSEDSICYSSIITYLQPPEI